MSDYTQALKPEDLVFILAIAGRIDAQQAPVLKPNSQQKKHIETTYTVLDSLSSSYSMFRYFFDVCVGGNADEMHNIMLTTGGIIGITLESIFLVSFSLLANYFKDEKKDTFKKLIATAWPYLRDIMKGLKNAYKGWRSTLVTISLLSGTDIKFLIAPMGIVLGIIAALNRILLNYFREQYKTKINANTKLLKKLVLQLSSLTPDKNNYYFNKIKYQSIESRILTLLTSAIGGFIDGLYLYAGVLTLTVLCPPILIAMTALCTFYTLVCVITRVYEEYDSQLKLTITQTQCKLVLITRKIEAKYKQLFFLQTKINKSLEDIIEINRLKIEMSDLISILEKEYNVLQQRKSSSYLASALWGMKNGLHAYGVFASILFFVNSILLISTIAMPPLALIIGASMGLALIAGFLIHALVMHAKHLNQPQLNIRCHPYFIKMKERIKADALKIPIKEEKNSIINDLHESTPQLHVQEWSEVGRSLFSGLGKGQKFVEFAGNMLQERNAEGHFQDTPLMYSLEVLCALGFGVVLSSRAFVKEFGKNKPGEIDFLSMKDLKPPSNNSGEKDGGTRTKKNNLLFFKTQTPGESKKPEKPAIDSPPKPYSPPSSFNSKSKTPNSISNIQEQNIPSNLTPLITAF